MSTQAAANESARPLKRTKIGLVVSDKSDKTRTVRVDYQIRHPKYGKYLKRSAKFKVHDEKNESKAGDRIEIATCRPMSRTKSWRLVKVVERGVLAEAVPGADVSSN